MTPIIRREPFGSLIDDFFGDFLRRSALPASGRANELSTTVSARMDVVDKGDRYAVTLDLPGVKKDDIHVTVDGARVSITAETKGESETKEGDRVLHAERYATSYARAFELPIEVTESGADARFDNGVLRLSLPKRQQVEGKRLSVR